VARSPVRATSKPARMSDSRAARIGSSSMVEYLQWET
jgi:hypothetical protein